MSPVEKDHSAGLNGAVAAVLRGERAATGLTLDQLAEKSGISLTSVQRFLQAKRDINVAVLAALAEALDTTPEAVVAAAQERLARQTAGKYAIQTEAARDEDNSSH